MLILDIRNYATNKIEIAKNKFQPTDKDLNPSKRFTNNRILIQIEQNKQLKKFLNDYKFSWVNYPELIKKIFNKAVSSKEFLKYANEKEPGYKEDKQIVIDIFTDYIATNEDLFASLEEQSIYWNDDIEFIISMIIKTIGNFKENQNDTKPLASLYNNDDDIEFVKTLFRKTIVNHQTNKALISTFAKNWKIE